MPEIDRILEKKQLSRDDIVELLNLKDPAQLQKLYDKADKVRQEVFGNIVHLRGIIELSNHCARWCQYCGLNAGNNELERYRMSKDEILEHARNAFKLEYKTLVLQSGEDNYYTVDLVEEIIRAIKDEMDVKVTLSLGERPNEEYARWKKAGADRYLIKHETSDPILYQKLHPDMKYERRLEILKVLKKLGYEAGSGIMIGLPGQTLETLANDILLFKELKVDMVGMGPYMPHPGTPLYKDFMKSGYFAEGLEYDIEEMTYKVLAITRIVNKNVHLPATTSLATTNPDTGRELALSCGANVVMPNVTDINYRLLYEIYPAKVCTDEKPEDCVACIRGRIKSVGRLPL